MIVVCACLVSWQLSAQKKVTGSNKTAAKPVTEEVIEIKTSYGNMYIWLYKSTPKHRENFLKLARQNYFDSTTFHRVIQTFMIQGGDPYSKNPAKQDSIGEGGPGYEIDAEIIAGIHHKKGVIAAARNSDQVNPLKRSSGSQFYIVQGKIFKDSILNIQEIRANQQLMVKVFNEMMAKPENARLKEKIMYFQQNRMVDSLKKINDVIEPVIREEAKKRKEYFSFTPEQRKIYSTVGGTPHLDNNYTVFGEVLKGIEVVDKIAAVKTSGSPLDRPLEPVLMDVNVLKFTPAAFKKKFGVSPSALK